MTTIEKNLNNILTATISNLEHIKEVKHINFLQGDIRDTLELVGELKPDDFSGGKCREITITQLPAHDKKTVLKYSLRLFKKAVKNVKKCLVSPMQDMIIYDLQETIDKLTAISELKD